MPVTVARLRTLSDQPPRQLHDLAERLKEAGRIINDALNRAQKEQNETEQKASRK